MGSDGAVRCRQHFRCFKCSRRECSYLSSSQSGIDGHRHLLRHGRRELAGVRASGDANIGSEQPARTSTRVTRTFRHRASADYRHVPNYYFSFFAESVAPSVASVQQNRPNCAGSRNLWVSATTVVPAGCNRSQGREILLLGAATW